MFRGRVVGGLGSRFDGGFLGGGRSFFSGRSLFSRGLDDGFRLGGRGVLGFFQGRGGGGGALGALFRTLNGLLAGLALVGVLARGAPLPL